MALPFEIQCGDFTDEEYAALSRYYSQPYYARDGSEIAGIARYPWLRSSSHVEAGDGARDEGVIDNGSESSHEGSL